MESILGVLLLSLRLHAAIAPDRFNPEYLAPNESVTVIRGSTTLCMKESPMGGFRGMSFIQLGPGACPPKVASPEGWVRPEEEANSPGIPFKGRGL